MPTPESREPPLAPLLHPEVRHQRRFPLGFRILVYVCVSLFVVALFLLGGMIVLDLIAPDGY